MRINRNIITNICAAVLGLYGSTEAIAGRMNLDKAMRTIGPTIALFFTGSKDGEMDALKKRLGLTDRDVAAVGNIGQIILNQAANRIGLKVVPNDDDNTDRDYRGSGRRMPGVHSDRATGLLGLDGIGGDSLRSGAGLNADTLDQMAGTPFVDYGRGGSGDRASASVAPGDDLRAIDAAQAAEQLRDRLGMPAKSVSPRVLKNWAEFNAAAQPPAPIASSAIPFPEQDDDLVASESLPQWRS